MQIDKPEPPPGQHFLLRDHLRRIFDRAAFDGPAWTSCTAAFLAYPGVPVLAQNATTQAPATFFRKLFEPKQSDDAAATATWTTLLQQLESLGDTRVTQLIATDQTSSWVVFLSDDLNQVLAYGGRPLPGPRYSMAEDDDDLRDGGFVREVLRSGASTRPTRHRRDKLDAIVELTDESGQKLIVRFERALRERFPESSDAEIHRLIEISGVTGRTWFVFEPVVPTGGRVFAIQASAASWRQEEPNSMGGPE